MTERLFIFGGNNAFSDGQVRQIIAQGNEIESHTMSPPQLSGAKAEVPIRHLAHPYSDYDNRVINAMIVAGYDGALAAWGGGSWTVVGGVGQWASGPEGNEESCRL